MPAQSIASIIQGHAQRKGSAPAMTYPDGTLSWRELDRRSNQRARLLASLDVKRDDLVAVMLPNGSEFHEAVVAVWKAGATPCVMPSRLPGREASEMLALARPAAVIGDIPVAYDGPRIAPGIAMDLILRGGANAYPAEVEAVLDEHPLVSSSAVIGLPSEDLGERVHAIIQVRRCEQFDLASIVAHVEDRLAKYKRPASYELSDTPLRDDAGKVRRSALKAERRAWLEAGRTFEVRPS